MKGQKFNPQTLILCAAALPSSRQSRPTECLENPRNAVAPLRDRNSYFYSAKPKNLIDKIFANSY
jgi:hypothetical protein